MSVRYYNQTGPFWDFVANLEDQGRNHPFFGNNNNTDTNNHGEESDNEHQRPNPWTEGWGGFPFGPMPHRGHGPPPHGHHHGPPPPPHPDHNGPPHHRGHHHGGPPPPPPENENDSEEGPSEPRGPPPPFSEERGSRCGPGRRHGAGGHKGRGGAHGRGGWGGWGGRGRGGPFGHPGFGPMGGFAGLASLFQDQLSGDETAKDGKSEDFKPDVDVFDTADSFIVHVSLPGAKKEDVGVNYDAEKSELSIAGVISRPGDEEFMKTLALDERKIGAFERKVRLGSRANPAQVDVDAISAKMQDGVLQVEVPKLDSGYVEIKKVDIE